MIHFKSHEFKLEMMKRVLSVIFIIAILTTMTTVTAIDMMPDAEAFKKGSGVYNPKYGSATAGIVCGDMLCSEMGHTKSSDMSITKTKSTITQTSSGSIIVDSIMGATIKGTEMDRQSGTVTVSINAQDDGNIMLNLSSTVNDVFMVIVDDEEWDDTHIDRNQVKVYFYAGAEKIEIIGNVIG